MQPSNVTPMLIFELGSLQIYQLWSDTETKSGFALASSPFYWRDHRYPNGFGPFTHILYTLQHYKTTLKPKEVAPVASSAVVNIDFVNKRRI